MEWWKTEVCKQRTTLCRYFGEKTETQEQDNGNVQKLDERSEGTLRKEHLQCTASTWDKGDFAAKLEEAAEQTYLELDQLELEGMTPHEAWEMVREKYLFLPEETTTTED